MTYILCRCNRFIPYKEKRVYVEYRIGSVVVESYTGCKKCAVESFETDEVVEDRRL